jgi:hypothetical protein
MYEILLVNQQFQTWHLATAQHTVVIANNRIHNSTMSPSHKQNDSNSSISVGL